jgi:hypothetical protein
MQLITFITISVLSIVLLYLKFLRPWQLRWGATDDEVKCAMPGDEIVQEPHFVATRAVSIEAPPPEVWKWIIQIGAGRAGFYSIDRIDNANVPSSKSIVSKYQKIEKDYFIPFTPDQKMECGLKIIKNLSIFCGGIEKEMEHGLGSCGKLKLVIQG